MSTAAPGSRPVGLLAAVASTLALAAFFLVMAALSLSSGQGALSGGVAGALAVWGLATGAAGWALFRLRGWARGPVVAAGLLHVLAFGQFTLTAPWAALGALAGLTAVVGAVWPSTRAALSATRS